MTWRPDRRTHSELPKLFLTLTNVEEVEDFRDRATKNRVRDVTATPPTRTPTTWPERRLQTS